MIAATVPPVKVTPARVGQVRLHATWKSAHAKDLVGRIQAGCELDTGARAAVLRAPLRGAVELSKKKPRRIKSIIVTKHATARGVAIGDRRKAVKRAYPKATFDTSVQDTFGITLVRVPKDGGGRLQIALDADSNRVTEFGVPYIRFCE
jgi:hypothetical protein